MKDEYFVVSGSDIKEFNERIKNFTNGGWEPFGSISTCVLYEHTVVYTQMMKKSKS